MACSSSPVRGARAPVGLAVALLAGTLGVAAGCAPPPTIGGPCAQGYASGKDPCGTGSGGGQFYYPSGLALDGAYPNTLYLSNGNADLRYSGGTVMAIDVVKFECTLLHQQGRTLPTACAAYKDFFGGIATAPIDATVQKNACRRDLFDPNIVECDEDAFITSVVEVGNFAGSIRIQTSRIFSLVDGKGGCPAGTTKVMTDMKTPVCQSVDNERLWLPVRGDPSLTFVDVPRADGGKGPTRLSCPDPDNPNASALPDSCVKADQRVTVRDFHTPSAPGYDCRTDMTRCVSLPTEPFGIFLDQGCGPDSTVAACAGAAPYAHLLVAHMSTGEVTYVNAGAFDPRSTPQHTPTEQVVYDVRGGFFPADAGGNHGSFAVAPQQPGNPSSWWYLTSRTNPLIATFRLGEVNLLLQGASFSVNNGPFSTGSDVRDLVFEPCGPDCPARRAFAVENSPPSLFTVDTRIDPMKGQPAGLPRNQVVDIVNVCQGPAHLALRRWQRSGPVGPENVDRLYVNCFDSNEVLVVDPDLAVVVATILTGNGPNDMAFNFGFDEQATPTPGCLPDGTDCYLSTDVLGRPFKRPVGITRRLYVSDFAENTIAVIDLEPGSSTENHVIGRIGLTDPPRIQ